MGDKEKQNFKKALKAEVSPLLIGVRNEIAELGKKIDKLVAKKQPDVIKTKETNPLKFPTQIEAKITNPQERVEVKGIKGMFEGLYKKITQSDNLLVNSILQVKTAIQSQIFKVEVQNQKEVVFPKVQTVDFVKELKEILKELKQAEVQRVKIENSEPGEAIPVVLTTRNRKALYDIIFQVTGGSNLGNVKKLLQTINTTLENLDITINAGDISIGAVELKDETSDVRVNVTDDGGKNAVFVQSNSLAQEATLALVKTELIAIKGFVDGIEGLLTSIDGKDFATETTLSAISGFVDGIEGLLTSIDGKDFATETTLAKIDTAQGAKTDVAATGNGSVIAVLKRIRTLLANIPLLTFVGDRLKVDAEVIIMSEPRPGLRVAEFLKESGGSSDLNVDGSITPVTFSASPPTGKKWFIHSISLIIEDASINFTRFGGIPGGLTNGIEFRVKEGGLIERTLGTFKTNGDLHIFTTDIRIDSAATDLLTLQANVKETSGTTFELQNVNSEIFKLIVNDDLTTINRFNVLIRGFEVDE